MKHNYVPDGCFLLARQMFESAIWKDDPHVLKLFIYLIGKARHREDPKKYPGFEIKRGELVTSLAQISDNNEFFNRRLQQWSRSKVSRMLAILKEQGYIEILADTYGTHISICNYSLYQDLNNYKANTHETQVKRKCNANETQVDIYNNDKNGNNENKKPVFSFDDVWKQYPNKDSRGKAEKSFNKSVTTEELFISINKALDNYIDMLKLETWRKPQSGSTWFNNWQDWIGYEAPISHVKEVYMTMTGINGEMVDLYSQEEVEAHKLLLAEEAMKPK